MYREEARSSPLARVCSSVLFSRLFSFRLWLLFCLRESFSSSIIGEDELAGELWSEAAAVEASLSLGALACLRPGGVHPIIDVSAEPSEHSMARAPRGRAVAASVTLRTAASPLSTWRATMLEP